MYRIASLTAAVAYTAIWLTAQTQAQQPSPKGTATAPAAEVVVTGCVQTEADYRSAHEKKRGGPLGTGLGSGNEFVLVDASPSRPAAEAVGTSGLNPIPGTMTYELGGKGEGALKEFVSQRVEITGTLKAEEIGRSGPTGGPSAKLDIVSEDLKVRELDVISVRPTTGGCNEGEKR